MVTKIKFNCVMEVDRSSTNLATLGGRSIRLALVQDTQCNGVAALPADPWTADNAIAFQTLIKMGRFRVLKEKTVWIENNGLMYDTEYRQAPSTKVVKLSYTPKTPIRINFNETNSEAVSAIVDNNFFIVACTPASEVYILQGRCRVSFKDI